MNLFRSSFIFTFLLFLYNSSSAQLPIIDWYKCYGGDRGEGANYVQPTSDGGYIFAGLTDTDNNGDVLGGEWGMNNFWIVKTNNTGQIQWQRNIGSLYLEEARAVKETPDGGYIVVGFASMSTGDVSGSHGAYDVWVVKLNNSGAIEWQKCFGGMGHDEGTSFDFTTDGGIVVAGYAESNNDDVSGNHGQRDFWIIKLTQNGNLVWQKCYGGYHEDIPYSIQTTTDGGSIVVGHSQSVNDGDVIGNASNVTESADAWIIKLDASGNKQWQKVYGGTRNEFARSVKQTPDGGYIIAGESASLDGIVQGNHGLRDAWILKLSATGNIQWQKSMGGSGEDAANDVVVTSDGGYVFAGYSSKADGDVKCNVLGADTWIFKLNASGSLVWQKNFGGMNDDYALSINAITDNQYIISGSTFSEELPTFHPLSDPYAYGSDALMMHLTVIDTDLEITINGPEEVCNGSSADYVMNMSHTLPSTNMNYDWLVNGADVSSNQPLHLNSVAGETEIVCRVTYSEDCSVPLSWYDTIKVKAITGGTFNPTIIADKTTICEGEAVTFDAVINGTADIFSYEWHVNGVPESSGGARFTTSALKPGDDVRCRLVLATTVCSESEATTPPVSVQVIAAPDLAVSPSDTIIKAGSEVRLQWAASPGASVTWQPSGKLGDVSDDYAITVPLFEDIVFTATASIAGCSTKSSSVIKVNRTFKDLPNAFTPNGDGLNDEFYVPRKSDFILKEMMIFDRWGNRIFSSRDHSVKWNGWFNGKPAEAGVYVYTIIGTDHGVAVKYKGVVNLVR